MKGVKRFAQAVSTVVSSFSKDAPSSHSIHSDAPSTGSLGRLKDMYLADPDPEVRAFADGIVDDDATSAHFLTWVGGLFFESNMRFYDRRLSVFSCEYRNIFDGMKFNKSLPLFCLRRFRIGKCIFLK